MASCKKSFLKRTLIIIISVLIAFVSVSLVSTKIIYDNIFQRYGTYSQLPSNLLQMVGGREEKQYYSGENRLCGYLYRSYAEKPKDCLIIFAPGFNAGADDYIWQINSLLSYGWSVFAFDATGSFKSEGESSVGYSQILLDLEKTVEYVENNSRFGYNDIVLFGHSRGGYAACCSLRQKKDISAVVSVSAVNSAMEGVICSSTKYVGPFAYGNYGGLWLYQASLFGKETVALEAFKEIEKSDVPTLIIHGEEDKDVALKDYSIMAYRNSIKRPNVEYILCSEKGQNGHTDLLFNSKGTANAELMADINNFLLSYIK